MLVIGGFATLVAALLARTTVEGILKRRGWSNGAAVTNLSQAMLAGLLAGWSAFVVIPEGATARVENALRNLAQGQEDILARLPQLPETARIVERIPGYWGEPGCRIVWRFTLLENTLTAEIVETLPGLPPYRMLASVTAAQDHRLDVTGEEPIEARGMAATFTLDESGSIPRLSWMDRSRAAPLLLEPCQEPAR
ncbi:MULTISPECIES: hypothetical protein [Hyphobacterium]|uniref:Uncharacterized protein n=1 Tax=Hyphobacterium vulgare TaxID=1736751 RepID=A0ABV6ZYK3_9PROT